MQYAIIEIEYNDMKNQYGYIEQSQKNIVIKEVSPAKDLLHGGYGPYKTIIPVFDNMNPGYTLSYLDMIRIRATFKTDLKGIQGRPTKSHINPADKLPVFTKEEKGKLSLGNFRISPKLMITYEIYQDDNIDIYQVAQVKGFKGLKGITRAKREVVYLDGEKDTLNERISTGKYPIISPDGITTGYEVRPEIPLIPDPVQVKEPVKPDIYEEIAIMNAELMRVELIPGMDKKEYEYNDCDYDGWCLILQEFRDCKESDLTYPHMDNIEYPGEIEELNSLLLKEYLSDKLKPVIVPIVPSKQAPKLPVQNIVDMWMLASKTLTMIEGVAI
jgi:hypothetical protein